MPTVGGLLSIFMVIFEIASATITISRTIQALRVSGPWKAQKKGITYLLLEQGLLYFTIVTVLTVASLALNVNIPGGFLQRLLNAITLPLSGMMTARFLLHLRKCDARHRGSVQEHIVSMEFASPPAPRASAMRSTFEMEFGEDPVRRARTHGIDLVSVGEIAEVQEGRDGDGGGGDDH